MIGSGKLSSPFARALVRWTIIGLAVLPFVRLAIRQLKVTPFALGIDDANITFVYARHLIQGHGLVYNIGGERVEGFTSLLWVLISAIPYRLGMLPEPFLFGLNLVMLASVLTLFTYFIDRQYPSGREEEVRSGSVPGNGIAGDGRRGGRGEPIALASLFFVAVLYGSPAYVTWTTLTLMDLPLWSALLAVLTLQILRLTPSSRPGGMSAIIALLVLARPEAMVWGPIFLLLGFLKLALLSDRRRALRFVLVPGAVFAGTLAALTLFRILYFGYPLPNTFYAKVSPDVVYNLKTGLRYLADYVFFAGAWVSLAVLASVVHVGLILIDSFRSPAGRNRRPPDPAAINGCIVGVLSWVGLGVPVLIGGDYFGGHRMYQAIYPILVMNLLLLGSYVAVRMPLPRLTPIPGGQVVKGGLIGVVLLAPILTQGVQWKYFHSSSFLRMDFIVAQHGRKIGSFMNTLFEPLSMYPKVGVFAAGGYKVTYQGPILDVLGLNDVSMGHSQGDRKGANGHAAFNRSVLFDEMPEVMINYIDDPDSPPLQDVPIDLLDSGANLFLKGLYGDPEFRVKYAYARVRRTDVGDGRWLRSFYLKTFLERLQANPAFQVQIAEPKEVPADSLEDRAVRGVSGI